MKVVDMILPAVCKFKFKELDKNNTYLIKLDKNNCGGSVPLKFTGISEDGEHLMFKSKNLYDTIFSKYASSCNVNISKYDIISDHVSIHYEADDQFGNRRIMFERDIFENWDDGISDKEVKRLITSYMIDENLHPGLYKVNTVKNNNTVLGGYMFIRAITNKGKETIINIVENLELYIDDFKKCGEGHVISCKDRDFTVAEFSEFFVDISPITMNDISMHDTTLIFILNHILFDEINTNIPLLFGSFNNK